MCDLAALYVIYKHVHEYDGKFTRQNQIIRKTETQKVRDTELPQTPLESPVPFQRSREPQLTSTSTSTSTPTSTSRSASPAMQCHQLCSRMVHQPSSNPEFAFWLQAAGTWCCSLRQLTPILGWNRSRPWNQALVLRFLSHIHTP